LQDQPGYTIAGSAGHATDYSLALATLLFSLSSSQL